MRRENSWQKEWQASLLFLDRFLEKKKKEHTKETAFAKPVFGSLQKQIHELPEFGSVVLMSSKNNKALRFGAAAIQLLAVFVSLQEKSVMNLTRKDLEGKTRVHGMTMAHFKEFRRPRVHGNVEIVISDIALSLAHELLLESKMKPALTLACNRFIARTVERLYFSRLTNVKQPWQHILLQQGAAFRAVILGSSSHQSEKFVENFLKNKKEASFDTSFFDDLRTELRDRT